MNFLCKYTTHVIKDVITKERKPCNCSGAQEHKGPFYVGAGHCPGGYVLIRKLKKKYHLVWSSNFNNASKLNNKMVIYSNLIAATTAVITSIFQGLLAQHKCHLQNVLHFSQ